MSIEKREFISAGGETLAARFDRPDGPVRGYALFAHCFTCTKDIIAARRIAGHLANLGVAVLRFDFTGLGSSQGEFANTSFASNVDDLVAAADKNIDTRVRGALDLTLARFTAMKRRAETVESYDQMIGEANDAGNAVVEAAVQSLIGQTKEFERAISVLKLKPVEFEGSDSLDQPGRVLQ